MCESQKHYADRKKANHERVHAIHMIFIWMYVYSYIHTMYEYIQCMNIHTYNVYTYIHMMIEIRIMVTSGVLGIV